KRVFLLNSNPELSSTTSVVAASLTYTFSASTHHLIVAFSAVGAIANNTNTPALMFLGCIVDRSPCVGTQKNPSTTPAGYANVLSNNYPSVAGWDNTVGYTWFTNDLSAGTHTIVIIAAVGN